jgi:hypothetical protein
MDEGHEIKRELLLSLPDVLEDKYREPMRLLHLAEKRGDLILSVHLLLNPNDLLRK